MLSVELSEAVPCYKGTGGELEEDQSSNDPVTVSVDMVEVDLDNNS